MQEVAAAQNVLIVCGHTEVDGYAFCVGLNSLEMAYRSRADLVGLIHSTTYLIRRVVFRPKYYVGRSDTFSLRIRPLGELIDMYHSREASDPRDKVYALLGMSSDRQQYSQLSADYKVQWKDLLQQLVKLLVTNNVAVATWDNEEISVFEGKGSIVGEVTAVDNDQTIEGKQRVHVLLKAMPDREDQVTQWMLQPFAKSVKIGDLICILQGARRPTIVRPHADYCTVIAISITPMKFSCGEPENSNVGWRELVKSTVAFSHDVLLAWDWRIPNEAQEAENKDYASFICKRLPKHGNLDLQNRVDALTRSMRAQKIMEDINKWKERMRQHQRGDGGQGSRVDWEAHYNQVKEDYESQKRREQELEDKLLQKDELIEQVLSALRLHRNRMAAYGGVSS